LSNSASLLDKQKPDENSAKAGKPGTFRWFAGAYQTYAAILVNTILLLVIVNALIYAIIQIQDANKADKEYRLRKDILTVRYPDFAPTQMDEIRQEMSSYKFQYSPFLEYANQSFSGKWLNISKHGFRSGIDNGPWPPSPTNFNIFVFGASTVFGLQLPDSQTIPVYLQEFLQGKCSRKVKVYNMGVDSYTSTQEKIQFSNLLADGIRPDAAVFIDGANDFRAFNGTGLFTHDMRELMDQRGNDVLDAGRRFLSHLPMMAVVEKVREKVAPRSRRPPITEKQIAKVIARYNQNKRQTEAIAGIYKTATLFVLGPEACYKYDLKYHPYARYRRYWDDPGRGYAVMAQILEKDPKAFGDNCLWLADMGEHATEPLYLDLDHYRAKFCKAVALEIGQALIRKRLVADSSAPQVVQPAAR
jgi:hypothetical protein